MHAAGTGMLAGGWWGHLRGAVRQVGLCAPASHPVDPEAVLLAEGLQAAKDEEQGLLSAWVPQAAPRPTFTLRLSPTWSWGPSASCSRASCGYTETGGQGGHAEAAGLQTPHPVIIPALPSTHGRSWSCEVLPRHGRMRTGPLPTGNYRAKLGCAVCPGGTVRLLASAGAHYGLYL